MSRRQFQQKIYYNPENYYETSNGSKISKNTCIKGSNNIQLSGKAIIHQKIIIRADYSKISLGKIIVILQSVIIKPSYIINQKQVKFVPIQIGDYVQIKNNCIISASKIGNNVSIGKNCIIGHRVIISDNVKIQDNTIIPNDMLLSSYCVFAGRPGKIINNLHQNWPLKLKQKLTSYHKNMINRNISRKQSKKINK